MVADFKLYGDRVGCSYTDKASELEGVTPDKSPVVINCWVFDFGRLPRGVSRQESTIYSMFHVTWTTFKFSRNQLGMVSVYVMSSVPWSNQRVH